MVSRGYPRLPREATAESSRPRSQPRERGRHAVDHPHHHLPAFKAYWPSTGARDHRRAHGRGLPRLLPGSLRRDYRAVAQWASVYRDKSVVVLCQRGQKLSEGTAAWLRHEGISAEVLEGG